MSIATISNSVSFARTQQAYASMGMDDEADGTEVAGPRSAEHDFEGESNDSEPAGTVGKVIDLQA
jgi:hypothetical protein